MSMQEATYHSEDATLPNFSLPQLKPLSQIKLLNPNLLLLIFFVSSIDMTKLATARDSRMYGPRPARNRWEYINAGIYLFSTILLIGGFSAQFSPGRLDDKSGLAVILIALVFITAVNGHDLIAHLAGVDFCVALVEFDPQLALVEFAVPLVVILGSVLQFMGILFLFIQMEKGYKYKTERNALNLLIAGPIFWVIGSIHNLCQVYERSNGHIQMLQKGVQIPFLMGSLLFLVAGVFNHHDVYSFHDGPILLAKSWLWLSIAGSLLFFIGGILNVVKVFKMQQMDDVRLEKLRGGALERLVREREGRIPLIIEANRRRRLGEDPLPQPQSQITGTPYKDVLVGGSSDA